MEGKIFINGEIGVDTQLLDVVRQIKSQSNATTWLVKINSNGGYVDSGWSIYNLLKDLDKSTPVTTYTDKAYSIASVIYMAGSTRLMPKGIDKTFMIHLPWGQVVGDTAYINDYLKELQAVENELVNFYSTEFNIPKDTILSLLQKETFLSSELCLELGIANGLEVPFVAVAKLHNNNKEINESIMNKLTKKLDAIFNLLNGTKAELVLQDAGNNELVFPNLQPTDVVSVDDEVTVNGDKAEGDFTMPDGSIITAVAGIVTVITPAAAADDTTSVPETNVENVEASETTPDAIQVLTEKLETIENSLKDLMTTDEANKLIELVEKTVNKQIETEAKYKALAKNVGSEFSPSINEKSSDVLKAKTDESKSFSIKRK